jgi:hypothetical protein
VSGPTADRASADSARERRVGVVISLYYLFGVFAVHEALV